MTKEEWYVIFNMNCKYEICRKCPKSGLFKGSYEECEKWIKQKHKEEREAEMKNKISMALKDPILQQGFEIICKNLADLEKEKDVIRRKADEAIADKLLITAKYNEILNSLNQEKDDLQKENAELRKDKEELCHSISEGGKACVYLNGQLTKAKELLKKLISAYTSYADSFDDRDNEIVEEAEQFLNSEVEK